MKKTNLMIDHSRMIDDKQHKEITEFLVQHATHNKQIDEDTGMGLLKVGTGWCKDQVAIMIQCKGCLQSKEFIYPVMEQD
jgi:hypothetical protein